MTRYIKWLGLVVSGYIICLIMTLPVATVTHFYPLPVKLDNPTGSLWAGQFETVHWDDLVLHQLNWKIKPLGLLTGKAVIDFDFGKSAALTGEGRVRLSLGGWQVENIKLSVPLAWAIDQYGLSAPATFSGDVELRLEHASSGSPWCEAITGQLYWLSAAIETPLGDLTPERVLGELSCNAGKPQIMISHGDPEVEVQAQGILSANRWQFDGKLRGGAKMASSLANALHYIGKRDAEGYYHFDFSSRL